MIRKIIKIDAEKCNGCGLCINACHEGAIGLVDGKAVLLRDDYCDGLGACLPSCPAGALGFEEREALEYNEAEVLKNQTKAAGAHPDHGHGHHYGGGCPGSNARAFSRKPESSNGQNTEVAINAPAPQSMLNQWPVQIKLVPINAPYFNNANLLIAADCAAYAHANFHKEFIKNRITIIGCPKLDEVDYSEKLTAILEQNNIKSVTVVKMEVPCCGGIENAVKTALKNSGKMIPWQVTTLSITGEVLD